MSYAVGVTLIIFAVAILIGMAYQILAYFRGRQLISRQQLILRLIAGILLLITIGMIFYTALVHFRNPFWALGFWGMMLFLPLIVIIIAWLDLRQLARTQHERQAELYRSLAHLEQELKKKPPHEGT